MASVPVCFFDFWGTDSWDGWMGGWVNGWMGGCGDDRWMDGRGIRKRGKGRVELRLQDGKFGNTTLSY